MSSAKTVLITGCSDGGIGSALAVVFQQREFHVFATARDPSKMTRLAGLPNVNFLTLDVLKSTDIDAVVGEVARQTGGALDYFVSNADRNHFMPILDEDLERVRRLFEVNFFAPIALVQAFAPLLVKSKGMTVFIVSTSGHLNIPYMGMFIPSPFPALLHTDEWIKGTYSASKMSIEIVADTLRLELSPFGVSVLEVVTGGVKTMGQTYFGDFKLPDDSLYKSIEEVVAGRAQGNDGMPRLETMEYATAVVEEVVKGTTGRFWYGQNAEGVKMSTTSAAVPQSAMDAGAMMGTGLDSLAN